MYKTNKEMYILQGSHLFFLIPLALAVYLHVYWYVVVISIMLFFSFLYHGIDKTLFAVIDRSCAISLILSNVILCLLGNLLSIHFLLVCILIPTSFYFLFKQDRYYWNHSLWHISSAYICVSSLLTYFVAH